MPSPDNTSIAPAFAVEHPAGVISQSITFGTPPSVEYGNVGILLLVLLLSPLLLAMNWSSTTVALVLKLISLVKEPLMLMPLIILMLTLVLTPGDITVNYEQVGESIVKATVARL